MHWVDMSSSGMRRSEEKEGGMSTLRSCMYEEGGWVGGWVGGLGWRQYRRREGTRRRKAGCPRSGPVCMKRWVGGMVGGLGWVGKWVHGSTGGDRNEEIEGGMSTLKSCTKEMGGWVR